MLQNFKNYLKGVRGDSPGKQLVRDLSESAWGTAATVKFETLASLSFLSETGQKCKYLTF